jgi:hypothetical protein
LIFQSIKYSLTFNKGIIVFIPYIVYFKYIIKIIVPKELKLKNIQKEIRKPITPKCQLRWDTFHKKKFNWITIWYILKRLNVSKALSSSNGNVCTALSIQNIDYKKWESTRLPITMPILANMCSLLNSFAFGCFNSIMLAAACVAAFFGDF